MPAINLLRVECNQCHKTAYTEDGANPDAALTCSCCPQQHDHAAAANACPGAGQPDGSGGHTDGRACGLGVDGCTVCRPITISVLVLVAPGVS